MGHGRKSAAGRFGGRKAVIAVDPESRLLAAADVPPGNAQDHERAPEPTERAEADAGAVVEEAVGDRAYGDGETRRAFAATERKLAAKVPNRRGQAQSP